MSDVIRQGGAGRWAEVSPALMFVGLALHLQGERCKRLGSRRHCRGISRHGETPVDSTETGY
jgi:hypothetical protein